MHDSEHLESDVAAIYRSERARLLARLIGVLRDFDLAEDALQDAFIAAMQSWPVTGMPMNPAGWLMTAAKRKAIDRIRAAGAEQRRGREWGELAIAFTSGHPHDSIIDDRLRLIFTCCHPALAMDAQVALTLRTIGGLSTAEVGKAFVVSETTLAQRLVRAKRKIRQSRIPYTVPPDAELPTRLDSVLTVIELIFNAGYLANDGAELTRIDLSDEAKRLALLVVDLMPGRPEPIALAALIHLLDARRAARADNAGNPLTLEEQDRELWDRRQIMVGLDLLGRSVNLGAPGAYALKASIAAVHSSTRDALDTDWNEIVRLYDLLSALEPSPVVALNRAVAVAMAGRPTDGLRLLNEPEIADALGGYHLFHATRADLLRRAGSTEQAAEAYSTARGLTQNMAEHMYLDRRLRQLREGAAL